MLGHQPATTTVVGRLRVRANGQDSLLTQMRLGRLLDPIELRPRQLPSSAILYIRTLRDPLPGALRLENGNVQPPSAWRDALGAALDRLASKASRPAREAVPPGADAVVFSDASELLSCVASDWCEGTLMTRWWWQSLLKQGATAQIVKELWRRDSQYVPAALQQLARRNKAADFVRALSDAEAGELLRGVARSFGLPALIRVLDDLETPADGEPQASVANQPKTVGRRSNVQTATAQGGPWRPWVPECRAADLRPEQEFFFGVALLLGRAPARARAAEFQASVREWQQQISLARAGERVALESAAGQPSPVRPSRRTEDAERLFELPAAPAPGEVPDGSRLKPPARSPREVERERGEADAAVKTGEFRESGEDVVKSDQNRRQTLAAQTASGESRLQIGPAAEASASDSPPVKSPAETTTSDWRRGDSTKPEPGLPPPSATVELPFGVGESPVADSEAAPPPPEGVLLSPDDASQLPTWIDWTEQTEEWFETKLGGVFYLINLGLALGFYGDFTMPDEPGIQLDIWDFVALLARELVGDDVLSDPVWPLLGRLAQREDGDLPGSDFDPETVSSFEFSVLSSEPGVSSSAADGEASPDPKFKTENSKLKTSPAVAAWLDRLMPVIRARLRQALGLAAVDDPGPLVCRQPARVCLTPTHLDVFFSLAELPLAIRFAGLDRDPGWVPAAGRFIAFHFE